MPDVLPELGSIKAAVNNDRQTVAKSGMLKLCLDRTVVGPDDGACSVSVMTSIVEDARMDIDPWTENARCIGSVLRFPTLGADDLTEPETELLEFSDVDIRLRLEMEGGGEIRLSLA